MVSSNDPIWLIFLKQFMNICMKQLARIMGKATDELMDRPCAATTPLFILRGRHFLGAIFYPLIGACIILLLIIAGREAYNRYCQYRPSPAMNIIAEEITLTLGNGTVIPVRIPPAAGVPYIRLDTDSILYLLKTNRGMDCNGETVLRVPAGFPPIQTKFPDGTLVHLNTGSSIQWPACFAGEKRQVLLQGEAYFEVAPDAQRIFTVCTGRLTVKAVGTCFNVNSFKGNDKTLVSLLEGNVFIASQEKEKSIAPGQTAILDHNSGQLETAFFDKRLVLAWRKGMYFFDGEPLTNICSAASRMYGVKIIIDSQQTGNKRFSGSINRQQALQHFLDYIKDTGNVEPYYDDNGQLHLK